MIIKTKSSFGETFKKYVFIFSFLAISLIHFAIFWVYINFDTIKLTFYTWNKPTQEFIWNGFKNYSDIITHTFSATRDATSVRMFTNTFRAIIINLIIFPIALIIAYAFYKRIPGTKAFRVIFYLPSIISIVILCTAYVEMFKPGTGPLYQLHALMGYTPDWLSASPENSAIWPCIYFFAIINGFGTNVILMASSMLRIPNEISESSRLDGCGFFRELFYVTTPCIMPTITSWMTMILTSVFGFYLQPMLIGGDPIDGATLTIPWQIFMTVEAVDKNTIAGAAALGIFLSVIMLPIVLLVRYLMKKITPEVSY